MGILYIQYTKEKIKGSLFKLQHFADFKIREGVPSSSRRSILCDARSLGGRSWASNRNEASRSGLLVSTSRGLWAGFKLAFLGGDSAAGIGSARNEQEDENQLVDNADREDDEAVAHERVRRCK